MEFLWFLSGLRTDFLNAVIQAITSLGEETALIIFICIIYWCVNKRLGCEMGFSFCLSGLLVQGLKIIFRIPRPWVLDPNFKPVGTAIEEATGYSFPSGHTQSATSVYGTAAVNAKKIWWKILFVAIFVLVGFSRMYLGVHTPKDVIVGWLVTLAVVAFVHYAFQKPERLKVLLIIIAVLCVALFVLGDSLYLSGIVEERYVKNCCQTIGAAMGFVIGHLFEQKYVQFKEKEIIPFQIGKVVIGLISVVILKVGMKAIFAANLIGYTFQNFILILFIAFLYPMLFNYLIEKHKIAVQKNK